MARENKEVAAILLPPSAAAILHRSPLFAVKHRTITIIITIFIVEHHNIVCYNYLKILINSRRERSHLWIIA